MNPLLVVTEFFKTIVLLDSDRVEFLGGADGVELIGGLGWGVGGFELGGGGDGCGSWLIICPWNLSKNISLR